MDSGETPVRGHTRHRPTGRRPLPAHLPRRRVEIDRRGRQTLRAGEGLLAPVVVSKYGDHPPLHRLEELLETVPLVGRQARTLPGIAFRLADPPSKPFDRAPLSE